ncbi:hypothetical protein SAMN05414139_02392 [Burkholderia sp. D7]|nr:hypothetical protein SAMN05414139_02392 [Burkholderia sp. D7]
MDTINYRNSKRPAIPSCVALRVLGVTCPLIDGVLGLDGGTFSSLR